MLMMIAIQLYLLQKALQVLNLLPKNPAANSVEKAKTN
jgi:hypothetical protein